VAAKYSGTHPDEKEMGYETELSAMLAKRMFW
jgi:hypothetical protein